MPILAILVVALGYFVDIFDLTLFNMLRIASLKDLGVPTDQLVGFKVKLAVNGEESVVLFRQQN